jgi:hypothetical protein
LKLGYQPSGISYIKIIGIFPIRKVGHSGMFPVKGDGFYIFKLIGNWDYLGIKNKI